MADRIKPHVVERVRKIREWEAKNNFAEAKDLPGYKLYKNYYVPESIVKQTKNVISFGVGGDVGFEKQLAYDNDELKVNLYDPTPRSVALIKQIIRSSSYKKVSDRNDSPENMQAVARIKFHPVAYGNAVGSQAFYYDPTIEETESPENALQSFSLVKREEHFKHVLVTVSNLRSIMSGLQLASVDIVKADIEGLWFEFANEILDNKIDCKFVALELELNFEKEQKVEPALDKAQMVCDKFKQHGYDVVINRRRDKLMLEMLFIRKDSHEG
tara:strand:- start:232 stop:1044 length:813 start_codon:yes stop_codon:yes gene_type:complete